MAAPNAQLTGPIAEPDFETTTDHNGYRVRVDARGWAMAKHFVYFKELEGGMAVFVANTENELAENLEGWMRRSCKKDDSELLQWMINAGVGTMKDHRLGVLVRMRDA